MKFMMLVCDDTSRFEKYAAEESPAPEDADAGAGSFPWLDEMIARGIRLDGDRLRPPSEATTVRVRDGEVLLADGPFAETKEAIAGFDIIECANLDEAIEVASKHPVAAFGSIEVRPFWP
jgi:hypothetical protein